MSHTELFFKSHHSDGEETIIMLHGLVSSSNEYNGVLPFLPSRFHVIIPDFPGHSKSAHIPLTTLAEVVGHVVALIRGHTKGGKAHLVGLSFGGYVALTLAAKHPELVLSCFATGASFPAQSYTFKAAPYIMAAFAPMMRFPRLVQYMSTYPIPDDVLADTGANIGWKVASSGYGLLAEFARVPIPARTLLCAASKSAADPIDEMGIHLGIVKGEGGNMASQAVVVKDKEHAWDIQAPELFAQLVLSWIQSSPFPEGVIPLAEWKA